MESSKRSKDTIALGDRLVEELGLQGGCDTLAKWMAHYLSDLIVQSEAETDRAKRRALQERCCRLIERLWANRESLPGGAKPLGRIEEALKAMAAMARQDVAFQGMTRSDREASENAWLVFARDSTAADRRMAAIALLNALLEGEFLRERRWVDECGRHLSINERKLIEMLDGWVSSVSELYFSAEPASLAALSPEERRQKILATLESSLQAHVDAFHRLKSQLEQNSSSSAKPTEKRMVRARGTARRKGK